MKIGIDLGGTKIEGVRLDSRGEVLEQQRIATPRGDYPILLEALAAFIESLQNGQQHSVGIGTPGSLGRNGCLRNSNTTELNGQPLQADLEKRLGYPVVFSNDANCFALSEATDGAAQGFASVFGVIIGTGTGGGLVFNGQLLEGANHIGGEWGHNPLPWPTPAELPGPPCYCGKHGCIETFLSGPGLSYHYRQATGEELSARAIAERADNGDATADALLCQYEDRLARALASVINIVDPDCIVLGGGLGNIARLYRRVPTLWEQYIFSDCVITQLLPPRHGDASGVRGAAELGSQFIA